MLNRSTSLAMSTSVLKALPGKLDIKRHSPSILYMKHYNYIIISEGPQWISAGQQRGHINLKEHVMKVRVWRLKRELALDIAHCYTLE